jgi:hypothetical protein
MIWKKPGGKLLAYLRRIARVDPPVDPPLPAAP